MFIPCFNLPTDLIIHYIYQAHASWKEDKQEEYQFQLPPFVATANWQPGPELTEKL